MDICTIIYRGNNVFYNICIYNPASFGVWWSALSLDKFAQLSRLTSGRGWMILRCLVPPACTAALHQELIAADGSPDTRCQIVQVV